jgi:cytochrome c5
MRIPVALACTLVLAACASQEAADDGALTRCEEPRPQVCTMEYAPSCATLITGGQKEYSSGCNACADDAVAGYVPGPCAE